MEEAKASFCGVPVEYFLLRSFKEVGIYKEFGLGESMIRLLKYLSPGSSHHQLFSSHTQAVNLEDEMVDNELEKAC